MDDMGTSTISAGTVIRGRIRAEGDLVVQGHVEGAIEASGAITIAEGALVKSEDGAIVGSSVAVAGAVNGSIRGAESVTLEAGARVVGDLAAPSIGVRPGALLRGRIDTTRDGAKAAKGQTLRGAATPAAETRRTMTSALQAATRSGKTTVSGPGAPASLGSPSKAAPPPPVVPSLRKRTDKTRRKAR
jgi:cytoskeletal protein CcmA (bactofilin family)